MKRTPRWCRVDLMREVSDSELPAAERIVVRLNEGDVIID